MKPVIVIGETHLSIDEARELYIELKKIFDPENYLYPIKTSPFPPRTPPSDIYRTFDITC